MKGHFTRDTFNPLKRFSRVLMQQGRVQLDADWNEQASILLHYLRSLAADLMGPHGGPANVEDLNDPNDPLLQVNCGFEIITDSKQVEHLPVDLDKDSLVTLLNESKPSILIGKGRYYVDGILCENEDYIAFSAQPGPPIATGDLTFENGESYLFYLDVWERHVTYVEDGDKNRASPGIREVALNGPDTATRAQVVWQIRTLQLTDPAGPNTAPGIKGLCRISEVIG